MGDISTITLVKEIPINANNIITVGNNLNSNVCNITTSQFNYYFNDDSNSSVNINTFAQSLGIGNFANEILSIQASGNYNDATITITTNDDYTFVNSNEINNTPNVYTNAQGSFKNNVNKYEHVTFAQYATIKQISTNINLDNEFTTITSNS